MAIRQTPSEVTSGSLACRQAAALVNIVAARFASDRANAQEDRGVALEKKIDAHD